MKTNELLKILKKGGCKPFRDAKGSHQIWHNPTTGEKCVVPIHPSKEVGKCNHQKTIGEINPQ